MHIVCVNGSTCTGLCALPVYGESFCVTATNVSLILSVRPVNGERPPGAAEPTPVDLPVQLPTMGPINRTGLFFLERISSLGIYVSIQLYYCGVKVS